MNRNEMLETVRLIAETTSQVRILEIEYLYNVDIHNPEKHTDEELGALIDAWADFDKSFNE